jgi:predicted outer membrane repeat protein
MRINDLLTFILLGLAGTGCYAQTVIQGGYVSGSWESSGNPYHIMGNITIHSDSSLFIGPDVIIDFRDSSSMVVDGHIMAAGEPGQYIYWESADIWDGIYINENPASTDTCCFRSCVFETPVHWEKAEGGILSINNRSNVILTDCWFNNILVRHRGAALYIENSDISILHSYFQHNEAWSDSLAQGGAIYMRNSSPDLFGNYFTGNEALNGAAIYGSNSSPYIHHCTFIGHTSHGGGGVIVFHDSGHVIIENCSFIDNSASGSGGALAFLESITAQLRNCEFRNNTAVSPEYIADGGAIFITPYGNNISIENCSFYGNLAEDDGGAIFTGADANIVNCLFYGNSNTANPFSRGGAIAAVQSGVNVLNSTFSMNWSPLYSAVFGEDASIALINSIVWDGEPMGNYRIFLSSDNAQSTLLVDHSNIEGGTAAVSGSGNYSINWAEGNMSVDPQFMLPQEDFSLAWNSPCINAGRSDTLILLIPPGDLAGHPRIMGGEIDMGAYEYQSPIHIHEYRGDQPFYVYPNPATEVVNIGCAPGFELEGTLRLVNTSGTIVMHESISISNGKAFQIEIAGLPAGVYLIMLSQEGRISSVKMLKQ